MTHLRTIYHLARADFLERTRRYSFLVTLGFIILLAYSYVPSRNAGYITLAVDGARGVYNSAWVGSLVAILAGLTMPVVGFFLVKNAVARDTQTGVGQIIAATQLTRPVYTLGKWLSNFWVLGLMVGVMGFATIVLQYALGEDRYLDLLTLLSPLLWIVLPTMALVAALSVLFETIRWLRGGLGNVIYFFLCTAIIMASFLPVMINAENLESTPPQFDIFGIGLPLSAMLKAAGIANPNLNLGNNSIGPVPVSLAGPLQTFSWEGLQWTVPMITNRLFWIMPAIAIALLASLFFNRFDPSQDRRRKEIEEKQEDNQVEEIKSTLSPVDSEDVTSSTTIRLMPLVSIQRRYSFLNALLAELRILRGELSWWWFLVAIALVIAGVVASTEIAQRYLLPITWLWPILIWSRMGTREARHHTQGLVFSNSHPIAYQLPTTWLTGVIVTALTGSGVAINLLRAGALTNLTVWIVAVFFIPTLALALAVWSRDSKLFEIVYLTLWYFGPLKQMLPQLDFMGTSDQAVAAGITTAYLVATLLLLITAIVGRHWQLRG